jgi:23S rRNA U2552 (ribose-2'-O)-methylase RlmE/FtsJ
MCAYNALRTIGQELLNEQELLPLKVKEGTIRKRLVHVIRYIIQMAGKLIRHSGKLVFKIYDGNEWLPVFRKLHTLFQEL